MALPDVRCTHPVEAPIVAVSLWARHRELAGYLAAGIAYIALGFVAKEVFAWWIYGAVFLIAAVWGVPALWRRLR